MNDRSITWPCGDAPFRKTIRGRFYSGRLSRERGVWAGLILVPLTFGTLLALFSDGRVSGQPTLHPVAVIVIFLSIAASTWFIGHRFLWGYLSRFLRTGNEATVQWRRAFAEAGAKTDALAALVPRADRSRDAFLRGAVRGVMETELAYVCSLTSPTNVSFSPRSFAGSAVQTGHLRDILRRQLVLELVRLGGRPVIFNGSDGDLIAIWQVAEVVQFWAMLNVECFGNEIRVSEKSGYQWWVPWTARSRILGLSADYLFGSVTKGFFDDLPGSPLYGFLSHPLLVATCSVLSLFAFLPMGLILWTWRVFGARRNRKRFISWHSPAFGDSLDLALLQKERSFYPLKFSQWTVDNIINDDGRPSYPDILERISARRELVGAAVTQAIEETINSMPGGNTNYNSSGAAP